MNLSKTVLIATTVFSASIIGSRAVACTNYLVTKAASADGSTMVSYAADSHVRYGELYWKPAATHPQGTMITLYDRGDARPLGQVRQVPYTYQVVGFMNEHQVSIGETTFDGRRELFDSTGIVDYGSLMFLALQRSKTAREAIKVIAELVAEYGYASTGESLSIGDPNEVWIMEIIGKGVELKTDRKTKQQYNANKGAVWVAIRIPDGYIASHANQSRITTFAHEDGRKSISSKNIDKIFNPDVETVYAHDVVSFAKSKNYYSGDDKDFSFCDAYAPLNFEAARFSELRVWAFFNRMCDGMNQYYDYAIGKDLSAARMPLFVKPNRKITPADLMAAKRDYLQGTELDMSKDPAGAAAFGLPYRWRPLTWKHNDKTYFNERVTATQQTGFSFIAQMRHWLPNPVGGVFWFGVDDAGSTVYVPFYCGITAVPHAYAEGNGDMLAYSSSSAFWIFNRVAHFAYLFYDRAMTDVRKVQSELETKFISYQPAIDAAALQLYNSNQQLAQQFLTDYSSSMANETVAKWNKLSDYLLVKYLDGNVKHEENGKFRRNEWGFPVSPQFPGYSDKWKQMLIDETGERFEEKE
jgi:dipeptidase